MMNSVDGSSGNGGSETKVFDLGMKFRLIHPATFVMGSSAPHANNDETPHTVEITRPFWIGIYTVTQKVYEAVMGVNPSYFKGEDNPVERVNWEDATLFCEKLNA